VPSVVAINGFALGGGLEMALAAAFRVMSSEAQVGVPEVKLGLFPGFGGTVRLSRVANVELAIDWVASGRPASAEAALQGGVVDEIAPPAGLRDAALALLRRAVAGEVDWRACQAAQCAPVKLDTAERDAIFDAAIAKVEAASPKHQPAAVEAVKMMARAAALDRAGALAAESLAFASVAKTQAADALVQSFLSDQVLKKLFRQHASQALAVKQAVVMVPASWRRHRLHERAARRIRAAEGHRASRLELGLAERRSTSPSW